MLNTPVSACWVGSEHPALSSSRNWACFVLEVRDFHDVLGQPRMRVREIEDNTSFVPFSSFETHFAYLVSFGIDRP